ncbi:MAG: RdgB/HAM1 family non-canonical purine NTP pyrophosphatase [Thaumarchaeota archaeon]|nr:RdgB/HAM1 family non-canonical purine NTP pyrophosphatase [Nitrososphaerota archaeon]
MPGSSKAVSFATSNRGKVLEARIIFKPFGLRVRPFSGKGAEIQADTTDVASYSAREAARKYGRAVMVEDAGLFVEALDGFPGPFSAYVFKTIGIEGLLALLEREKSRSAAFRSAVAYCAPDGEPHVFEGEVRGRITRSPKGRNGFGFDPVFLPTGSRKSMGELTLEEKCAISHRGEAMRKFAAWYSRP